MTTPAGFLLTMPDYDGTLAAARCLGSRGVPAYVAMSRLIAPAAWSRHVRARFACPPPRPVGSLFEWLLRFGKRHPGHVLYATSDDLAWLFAAHDSELSRYYRLYTPSSEAMLRVLDKKAMYGAASAVGLQTPPTEFPTNDEEIEDAVRRLVHPVLIKPRTQTLLFSELKGEVVADPAHTASRYRAFMADNHYGAELVRHRDDIARPMLQQYTPGAARAIYSVSGFCDETGEEFVARASIKVLQWPRRVGVGICFEDVAVDEELAEKLRSFCQHIGYYGVFEAEFVRDATGPRLIDFNPRFFGQMGFDDARGLPAAYLVYLAARRDRVGLRRAVEGARSWRPARRYIYVNRVALQSSLLLERILRVSGPGETERWRRWSAQPGSNTVDAIGDPADRIPGVVGGAAQFFHVLRHPRSVVRSVRFGV